MAEVRVTSNAGVTDPRVHLEAVNFGSIVLLAVSKTFGIRMAAVFMMSLATIWLRTGLIPRWLVGLSYLVALALLIVSDFSLWVTMAFPVWVLVVSGLLLV